MQENEVTQQQNNSNPKPKEHTPKASGQSKQTHSNTKKQVSQNSQTNPPKDASSEPSEKKPRNNRRRTGNKSPTKKCTEKDPIAQT